MRSEASLPLKLAALAGLLFLHLPILLIFLYAFTTEQQTFRFPPPGLTTRWFGVAWFDRPDIWPPLHLPLRVATVSILLALILGSSSPPRWPADGFSDASRSPC